MFDWRWDHWPLRSVGLGRIRLHEHRWPILVIVSGCLVACDPAVADAGRVTTTVYVGHHFEVRDHDQPVKYALNGDTRVARITGPLSGRPLLQRLRLRTGWNLISLAVTATNALQQLASVPGGGDPVQSAYLWNPMTGDYTKLTLEETATAGSVLWIKAARDSVVCLTGAAIEPTALRAPQGGGYVGSPGLEVHRLDLPEGVTIWRFDSSSGTWQAGFSGDLAPLSHVPLALGPGEAIYVHTGDPVELASAEPALRIVYYHQDHLGSSSAITDATGALIEEAAYYPFGATRHEERHPEIDSYYGFSQKEHDGESRLQYFGHRYLHPVLGRWMSTDPLGEAGGGLNPYAYVNQNPLKHHDPDGAEIRITEVVDKRARTTTYQVSLKAVFMDASSEKFSQQQVAAFASKLKSAIEKDFSGQASEKIDGRKWNYKWSTAVDLRVIRDWKEVEKDDHVFRIVDRTKSGARGDAAVGGMLVNLKASIYKRTGDRSPEETGSHEYGHSGGLRHDDRAPNLMMSGDLRPEGARDVGLEKIREMFRAFQDKRLNQRDEVMTELDQIAKRR
jgi:RHS repeat-associated protein